MIINIVGGSGIMGGVHQPIFEKAGHKVILSGRNSSPSIEEASKLADLTIVTVPIPYTLETIKKVAPLCKALVDFTGVKTAPIKAMLEFSQPACEVMGLHPLYGQVESVAGRTVVYCPTERTGDKCKALLEVFENEGAIIKAMEPPEHDRFMDVIQNQRVEMLKEYVTELIKKGLTIKEAYRLAPPHTKILLDLIARQVSIDNQGLYEAMRDFNEFGDCKKNIKKETLTPEEIREFFGEELEPAQQRARKYVQLSKE